LRSRWELWVDDKQAVVMVIGPKASLLMFENCTRRK
jgi:hypothetical protein